MEGDLWPCRRQDRLYQRRPAGKSPPLAKFKGEWHDLDMDWRDAKEVVASTWTGMMQRKGWEHRPGDRGVSGADEN
jgi:hypothetical protein